MQAYHQPAAVVQFDSAAANHASRRPFGRGVFQAAVYEPTPEERAQYIEMLERENGARFIATRVENASAAGIYPRSFDDHFLN